ncbi:MAG: NADH-quinone oxidoreductase subunit NuoB [Phycisphaerae bacterium]
MFGWFLKGAGSRVRTTSFPRHADEGVGITPGRPIATEFGSSQNAAHAAIQCPTQALTAQECHVEVNVSRCIHCMACARGDAAMKWQNDFTWAVRGGAAASRTPSPFKKSLHIRLVDSGSCDAVMQEIKQLAKPYYNMHKLGFFITPTPRHADVLMVTGPVTSHMRLALKKTYDAMPGPKWVIAVGNCAISGCVFAPSFMSVGAVSNVIPVDVQVPGCPPPPLAILHGLLLLTGRVQQAQSDATVSIPEGVS